MKVATGTAGGRRGKGAATGPQPLLHPAVLLSLQQQGGPALVAKLVGLFCQVAPQRVASLQPAVAAAEPAQARRAAHGLAPLAAQVGALRLHSLAEAAEDALVAGDTQALAALYTELAGCCDQVCQALRLQYPLHRSGG